MYMYLRERVTHDYSYHKTSQIAENQFVSVIKMQEMRLLNFKLKLRLDY